MKLPLKLLKEITELQFFSVMLMSWIKFRQNFVQFVLVNSRTFKHLPCFQVISRPCIYEEKESSTFEDAWEACMYYNYIL